MQDKIKTVLTLLALNEDIAVADVIAAATAVTLCHWYRAKDNDDEARIMAGRKTVIQVMTDIHTRQVPLEEDGDPEVGNQAIVYELDDIHLQLAGDSDTCVDEADSDTSESDGESDDDHGGDNLDGHPQDDGGQNASYG